MNLTKDKIQVLARKEGWHLEAGQTQNLADYCQLLFLWSKKLNLIGPSAKERFWEEHLSACLWLALEIDACTAMADLGSGAGLPGLVIACLEPDRQIHLFEARRKRTSFLKTAAAQLKLSGVSVHWQRVGEDMQSAEGLRYRTVTARAVGSAAGLLDPAGELLAPEGRLYVLTGPRAAGGLKAAVREKAGWRILGHRTREILDRQANLVVLGRNL